MIPTAFFFGGGRRTDATAGRQEGIIGATTVAWDDQFKRGNIMWKVPRNIRMNDNIVVREDEIAAFYRDGKDPEVFINQFVGTFGAATSADIEDRIKDELMKQLNVVMGKMKAQGLKVTGLAASLNDMEQAVLANSKPHFLNLGVEIVQMAGL